MSSDPAELNALSVNVLTNAEEEYSEEEESKNPKHAIYVRSRFKSTYNIFSEQSISSDTAYILHLGNSHSFDKIVAGTSDGDIHIFQIDSNSLRKLTDLDDVVAEKSSPNCGIKFLNDSDLGFFAGTKDGCIAFYDLRINQKVYTLEDNANAKRKPINCFDVNANNRVICAGTEQIDFDSFLLFFDIRQRLPLGGYWESHDDDISTVKFHPLDPDYLTSGSMDGLINIFDIRQTSEDDALKTVINNENGIQKLNWHKDDFKNDLISCINDINEVSLYNTDGDTKGHFSRHRLGKLSMITTQNTVPINCHNMEDRSIALLMGSIENNHLRLQGIHDNVLIREGYFEGNKQIIRDSLYNPKDNLFITGGEGGLITLWGPQAKTKVSNKNPLKLKPKIAQTDHKQKPY